MHIGNRYYRRSPSFPAQDSFGGPVSQDPAEQYLASTKQFDVPLSELGEMPTQVTQPTQEIHHSSPTDPGMTLPDASEHQELVDAAVREYDAQRANRTASNRRTNILVAATPSNSGESSGALHHKGNGFLFLNRDTEYAGQESRFEFDGSSSFDKMLDRGLVDPPGPTPAPTRPKATELAPTDSLDIVAAAGDGIVNAPPGSSRQCSAQFDWIAPSPNSAVASSNPRSLLRMVHPGNQYRIARMRQLAGDVEPPSCVPTIGEIQSYNVEETQPCHADDSANPNATSPTRPSVHQTGIASSRPIGWQRHGVDEDEELEDSLDIVPDSEPLRAGSSAQTSSHHQVSAQSPLKKPFHPLSPMSEHESGELVPDSLEVEESEADIPLAIEIASKNTKNFVAPTDDMTMHGRKTRIASSTFPASLEQQHQKPSSSTKGKDSRVKSSKTQPPEIPTSLPEQDLQGQASSYMPFPATATDRQASRKKRRGSQPSGPLPARHTSTANVPAAKPGIGVKRSRKSDIENSEDSSHQSTEDEAAIHHGVRKEEEEETEFAATDVDSPPPPPPKPDVSRKRRRTEDVNPSRGTSRASTSTRTKRSETPAVATRSGKKLRSGVSSARGLTAEPATRVFALWKSDGHYYSGVVYSRGPKTKYVVKFDDGTQDDVELKNLRRGELLVGDRVIIIQDHVKGVVSDVSRTRSQGSFQLEIDDGEAITIREVEFGDIRIANRTIHSQWTERTVAAEDICTVIKPKLLADTTPSRQSVISTTSRKVHQALNKTGFVVTISPKNDQPNETKDEAMRAIKQHGGMVIEDWSSVFTMEGRHFQSNKRWIATPEDFRWKSEGNIDRIFLLSDDAHQKPKFLLALALGIPCISFDWLTRGDEISSDWQPHLLPAGYSDSLGARISQLVDLDWGNCTEHVTDIMASRVPFKLFSQKTVLCVGAELLPLPNRAKKNASEEASRYVPWIILCMGAAKVEAVADIRQMTATQLHGFHYIIVKEYDVLGSIKLSGNVVVGDVNWVKECLVSLRLTIPELD